MKKLLSVLLVIVLLFTATPLGAFNFKASAESELEFNEYTYMADYLANIHVDPLTGKCDSIQSKQLSYHTDANNDVAHIMMNEINDNSDLKAAIQGWKLLNLKPSDVSDQMLDEVGYYKAIIFNVINTALKSESLNFFSSSSIEKLGLNLSGAAAKALKTVSKMEYDELCKISVSEIDSEVLKKLKDTVKNELTAYNLSGEFVGKVSDIISYANTFNDFVEDVANLSMVARTTDDIKNVLFRLYNTCPDDQTALKTALSECYTVCVSQFDNYMVNILNGIVEVANIAFGEIIDSVWSSVISSLGGGMGVWLLVAQTIGSSISNFAFSTEHIIEQGFAIECCTKFIDLAIKTVNDLETTYINDQSIKNAQLYLRAIDIMFASEELGCDYASEYADITYKEGLINGIQNLFGEDEEYTKFKKSVSSIKNSTISTHTELLDIDCYACYIEGDYPELYEEYYKYLSYFTYETNGSEIEITGLQTSYLNTEKIVIPSKIHGLPVTSIADFAFMQKDKLTKAVIPDSVKNIGKSAFAECFELNNISFGNGLESIDDYAFAGCEKLGALYLPKTLKTISHLAVPGCLNLTCVSVSSDNQNYSSLNGVLFSKDGSRISIYPPGLDKEHYTVPNGVKVIEPYAFNLCAFKSITLPASLTEIQDRAFYSTSLETIFYRGTKAEWLKLPKGFENDILFDVPVHFGTSKTHEITEVITLEPTCSTSGTKVWTCSCGYEEKTEDIPPIGHAEGERTCEYCGLSDLDYEINNNEVTITGCDKSVTNLIIPSKISGLPVTKISNFAFSYACLTSITIPDSVTSIGDYAFRYCSSLTSITIPNSVTSIGSDAFRYCSSLTSVTIGNSVISIGNYAFYNCTSLTSITIPDSVTSIGDRAFSNCKSLTSITIPNSVTSIGIYAFSRCTSLTSITIPNSVTSIGIYAFSRCTSLTSITIPDSVTSIGSWAFYNCYSLTSITISDSVTSIGGSSAFYNTGYYNDSNNWVDGVLYIGNHLIEAETSISGSYAIKSGTITIADSAFLDCRSLTSITIPDSVTSIGSAAFYNCTSLTSITIPDSVTSIGDDAFYDTGYYNNSSNWENDVLYIGNHLIKANTSISGSYAIKSGTITIADSAFCYCKSLTSITIPDSVTSIGVPAFRDCTSLTSINVSSGNNYYSSQDGILFNKDKTTLVCYLEGKTNTSYVIPNSVTSIGSSAFRGCTSLKSITIPDSVTSIGDYAFYYCRSLTSITIPDSVTSIGDYAFEECTSLTSITIPDSVTSIGDEAFWKCSSLTDVYYGGNESDRENITFGYDNTSLTNATWHYNYGVATHTPGDIDGNGDVSLTDIVTLAQHLAEWDVEYNEDALDVNGDGDVSLTDIVHLAQYLAEWENIELH